MAVGRPPGLGHGLWEGEHAFEMLEDLSVSAGGHFRRAGTALFHDAARVEHRIESDLGSGRRHGGGVRGYRSEMAFSDEANIGLVLLINAESSAINEVIPTFYEHLTNTL